MTEFEKILEIADSDVVELGAGFKSLIGTELCLGMTRYVCRHGTLSDGFEKITPAQRYYQAIREAYNLSNNIKTQKAAAMEAQADLMDAKDDLSTAKDYGKPSDILRAEARLMMAQNRLVVALVNVEDQIRQLDEFNKVRLELQDEVRRKYPLGIEQAEEDGWIATGKYRALKKAMGYTENLTHIPLPQDVKARLAIETGSPDLAAWYAVDKDVSLTDVPKALNAPDNVLKLAGE